MKSRPFDFLATGIAFLLLWQGLYWLVGPNVISSPADTLARAGTLVGTRAFWGHAETTLSAFGLASFISIVGGVTIGLWLGLSRFAAEVADPILSTLYSIPKITLYPLILLAFGLGLSAKVAFGAIHGIFPVTIFTMNAIRNVAPVYHRTALMMRLPWYSRAARIMAPAALPEMLAGVRIGISLTLLGTLIGELFASTSGIGFALMRAMDIHAVVDILALTVLLFGFAVTVNAAFWLVERWARHGS
jgi:NitT/TauT family transport system permease protein